MDFPDGNVCWTLAHSSGDDAAALANPTPTTVPLDGFSNSGIIGTVGG